MDANEAVRWVDPAKWQRTSAEKKLAFLKELQQRIKDHQEELFEAELKLHNLNRKNEDEAHLVGYARIAPIGIAKNVAICIGVYESLVQGKMPEPFSVNPVGDDAVDLEVFPQTKQERLQYSGCKGFIRVKGEPKQVSLLEKEGGITAIVGAGNFTSAFEMVRALFMENCAIVFKPPRINVEVDAVWEKVFAPLIEYNAVSYCDPKYGRELVKDERLKNIYFTGGAPAAQAIMASTNVELVSELGGNNPALIVPGIRPWTKAEIEHQARFIASGAKMNGGAVCGRVQTIVTCKHWPQRRLFLDALEVAIRDETPGFKNWYPGVDKNFAGFRAAYPDAKLLRPEGGRIDNSDFLLVEGAERQGYATRNEAFCQVLSEVPLDTDPTASAFLDEAVGFCNADLYGTLGCAIIIDDETLERERSAVERAITGLEYGGIAINEMPFSVGATFWLTWSGNEEGKALASGRGNFGNPMGLENVEKSILYCPFLSNTHLIFDQKHAFRDLGLRVINNAIKPSWWTFSAMAVSAMTGRLRSKDF